jgi:hypothetical protein
LDARETSLPFQDTQYRLVEAHVAVLVGRPTIQSVTNHDVTEPYTPNSTPNDISISAASHHHTCHCLITICRGHKRSRNADITIYYGCDANVWDFP